MEWWQIALIIVAAALSIMAVKITFSFNLNQWSEQKRERGLEKLRNLCPHAEIFSQQDGAIRIESLFHTTFGTVQFRCTSCGRTVMNQLVAERQMELWSDPSNFKLYQKRWKQFEKQAKKLGLI